MKGILVVIDGMGDLPCKQLGEKTPLEAAEMPNLDFLATRGEMGYMYPVKPGFVPGSDEAMLSIFGNDLISSTRGQLEARGTDMKLTRGDLALRVNFATIDSPKKGNLMDRRAGRNLTLAEAEILSKALNKIKLHCKFVFNPTIQHRAILVLRGGFSDNILGNDPHPPTGKIRFCKATDEDENSQYTANVLNEFLDKAYMVLDKHPVNEERRKKGFLPANYLLVRGAGIEPPKLKFYKKWLSIAYMPLQIGFSKVSGMKVFSFDYPRLKGLDSYKNIYEGLEKACSFSVKMIKKHHKTVDYAYIHIKETDLPGHDNKPLEKKMMLEYIDKTLFRFLRKFAPPNRIRVVVTADHSTPCKLKSHSADPVPVLFYNDTPPKPNRLGFIPFVRNLNNKTKNLGEEKKGAKFHEKNARNGKLGGFIGKELLRKVGFRN